MQGLRQAKLRFHKHTETWLRDAACATCHGMHIAVVSWSRASGRLPALRSCPWGQSTHHPSRFTCQGSGQGHGHRLALPLLACVSVGLIGCKVAPRKLHDVATSNHPAPCSSNHAQAVRLVRRHVQEEAVTPGSLSSWGPCASLSRLSVHLHTGPSMFPSQQARADPGRSL